MFSVLGAFANRLWFGSKITWYYVCKMSSVLGTFADRICQV